MTMFEKMKDAMHQLQMTQRLMQDGQFQTLLKHPKVQEVFRDPGFQALIKSQDMASLASHPKFATLMRDPELVALIANVDPQRFLQQS